MAKTHPSSHPDSSTRGATMVEFALCFVVFLMFVFATLEIARYMAIRGLLTKSAAVALSQSQKSALMHLDLRECAGGTLPERDYCNDRLAAFYDERDAINLSAKQIATSAFLSATSGAAILDEYKIVDPLGHDQKLNTLVLRPLEQAYQVSDNALVEHATAPVGGASATAPWTSILSNSEIEVRMRARVTPLAPWPFLPSSFIIEAKTRGYAEMPKTTHIPPAMGLPIPPLPTTTTTACVRSCNAVCYPTLCGAQEFEAPAPSCVCETCADIDPSKPRWCNGACYADCVAPQVEDPGTCGCVLNSCTPPAVMCGGSCQTCPGNQILKAGCVCGCGSGAPDLCRNNCYDCRSGTFDGSCNCIGGSCPTTACGNPYETRGAYPDDCDCKCRPACDPGETHNSECSCVPDTCPACPNPNHEPGPAPSCDCVCKGSLATECGDKKGIFDDRVDYCSCICDPSTTWECGGACIGNCSGSTPQQNKSECKCEAACTGSPVCLGNLQRLPDCSCGCFEGQQACTNNNCFPSEDCLVPGLEFSPTECKCVPL